MLPLDTPFRTALSEFRFIDLFAGIGGFRFALESFGASCVFSSEWNKAAQETYARHFGDCPAGDITKIAAKQIPPHEILCGGFPCQAFSISGKQQGFEDERGTLFFEIARIVEHHRPKLLLLENVKQFTKNDGGRTLATVQRILEELGYHVFYAVLNASEFGLPQKRERVYFVCLRQEGLQVAFRFPAPPRTPVSLESVLLADEETEAYRIQRTDTLFQPNFSLKPTLFGNHPLAPLRMGIVNKGGQGERIYHPAGHAITLSAHGGGIGAKTGLYLINGHLRKLAPRECARLQGFPESFQPHPSPAQAYQQFGNSVAINVLQSILIALIQQGCLQSSEPPSVENPLMPSRAYTYAKHKGHLNLIQGGLLRGERP